MNENRVQEQRQTLVQSDDCVTIASGETPVLLLSSSSQVGVVAQAINFLRCDVPSVQLLGFPQTQDVISHKEDATKLEDELGKYLDALELDNESFLVQVKIVDEKEEKEDKKIRSSFLVVTMTRSASRKQ